MSNWIEKFEKTSIFTPNEAWTIYKIVAISEAFGWTILIAGIVLSYYKIISSKVALPIAGQIHGTIFIAYFLILIFVYPSLKWKRTIFLLAIIAGIPPYGSIIFEYWISKHRNNTANKINRIKILINDGDKLLAVQPSHGIEWQLLTIDLPSTTAPIKEINKSLSDLFDINPSKLIIKHCKDKIEKGINTKYYKVDNSAEIFNSNLSQLPTSKYFIDEVIIINKQTNPELFLKLQVI